MGRWPILISDPSQSRDYFLQWADSQEDARELVRLLNLEIVREEGRPLPGRPIRLVYTARPTNGRDYRREVV
jgi:hypothetical protein